MKHYGICRLHQNGYVSLCKQVFSNEAKATNKADEYHERWSNRNDHQITGFYVVELINVPSEYDDHWEG